MDLAKLANRTVAIDVEINGRPQRLRGRAAYEAVSGVGPVLRIHIADPAGDFDVLLEESRWNGPIVEDRQSGCDYRIALTAANLCMQA
jgi:hypothetical protein